MITVAFIGAMTGLFSLLPLEFVPARGGRAAMGAVAGGLGALSALLWGLDLVAVRGYEGRMRRAVLLSSLLMAPTMALALVVMLDTPYLGLPALAAGGAMMIFMVSREIGRTGEPEVRANDRPRTSNANPK